MTVQNYPPKMTIQSSFFLVKNSIDNRKSLSKDGMGAWIQNRSIQRSYILANNNTY